jgi:chromosome segregation ATPase
MLKQDSDSHAQRVDVLEKDLTRICAEKNQVLSSLSTLGAENVELKSMLALLQSERDQVKSSQDNTVREITRLRDELRHTQIAKSSSDQRVIELQHSLVNLNTCFRKDLVMCSCIVCCRTLSEFAPRLICLSIPRSYPLL